MSNKIPTPWALLRSQKDTLRDIGRHHTRRVGYARNWRGVSRAALVDYGLVELREISMNHGYFLTPLGLAYHATLFPEDAKAMKFDRNINPNGEGKYALVLMRNFRALPEADQSAALTAILTLSKLGVIDEGIGPERAFMVIRCKDRFAEDAFRAYAQAALPYDPEYAAEMLALADTSGPHNPFCKMPD